MTASRFADTNVLFFSMNKPQSTAGGVRVGQGRAAIFALKHDPEKVGRLFGQNHATKKR